ncbi:MAG: HAMP domain-containing sensor histidine kinase [Prevotellaceae bacterium]|nr:HAMP domain-containing histidine kinase [Prevotella sp.]MDD7258599.1 HAMP domain-containing sensor histidine kinase [Prevotellaceae bacterium]MDY6130003.1 HAMP domain-containing sensor histidine kinase [Prevotella sp.]
MKKRTIWAIAIIMGFSFLALLFLQIRYIEEMVKMKKEQLDESVSKALYQASRNLELNETLRYLEKDVNETERKTHKKGSTEPQKNGQDNSDLESHNYPHTPHDATSYSSFVLKTMTSKPSQMPKALILRNDKNSISEATKSMQEIVKNRYVYQKALLDNVVYRILYTASDKPLQERINFKMLDQDLKSELMNNGVNIPYHFTVSTQDGREVYRCPDYSEEGEAYSYSQVLFRNDPQNKMGVVKIHFPDMNTYLFSIVRFMIPSIVFTFVLLVTFIITLVLVFRQKRLSEIKNDFINNMTHELKTPIASISLAAQMLNDESVSKSPAMLKHLGGVVNDESKRLRFLVEKVLQMSMFDQKKAVFKPKELDLNEMVESIANSFTLRVEHTGGKIYTDIGAVNSTIFVDEMHFQNVINNLLDNAVKYRKPDQPLDIYLKTWNDNSRLYLSIRDTGLGIKKENLKKVFEKFYRVHTGNLHDAKGFGLGLAYVKKVVDLHDGEIKAESEYKNGTTFTISLPVIKDKEP